MLEASWIPVTIVSGASAVDCANDAVVPMKINAIRIIRFFINSSFSSIFVSLPVLT